VIPVPCLSDIWDEEMKQVVKVFKSIKKFTSFLGRYGELFK
jgi:hypothetical protein